MTEEKLRSVQDITYGRPQFECIWCDVPSCGMSSRSGVWCATESDMCDIRASGRDMVVNCHGSVAGSFFFLRCCMMCKYEAGCSETYEVGAGLNASNVTFSSSPASITNGHVCMRARRSLKSFGSCALFSHLHKFCSQMLIDTVCMQMISNSS